MLPKQASDQAMMHRPSHSFGQGTRSLNKRECIDLPHQAAPAQLRRPHHSYERGGKHPHKFSLFLPLHHQFGQEVPSSQIPKSGKKNRVLINEQTYMYQILKRESCIKTLAGSPRTQLSSRETWMTTSGMDANTLQLMVEKQKQQIQAMELKLRKNREAFLQSRQKHLDINTQLVQANTGYQRQLSEANRMIWTLRNEKEELIHELTAEKASNSTLSAALAASEAVAQTYKIELQEKYMELMAKISALPTYPTSAIQNSTSPFTSQFLSPLPPRRRRVSTDCSSPSLSSFELSFESDASYSDEENQATPSPIESLSPETAIPILTPSDQAENSGARRPRRQQPPNYAEPSLRTKLRRIN